MFQTNSLNYPLNSRATLLRRVRRETLGGLHRSIARVLPTLEQNGGQALVACRDVVGTLSLGRRKQISPHLCGANTYMMTNSSITVLPRALLP